MTEKKPEQKKSQTDENQVLHTPAGEMPDAEAMEKNIEEQKQREEEIEEALKKKDVA